VDPSLEYHSALCPATEPEATIPIVPAATRSISDGPADSVERDPTPDCREAWSATGWGVPPPGGVIHTAARWEAPEPTDPTTTVADPSLVAANARPSTPLSASRVQRCPSWEVQIVAVVVPSAPVAVPTTDQYPPLSAGGRRAEIVADFPPPSAGRLARDQS
jgi:hypothetical protein